MAAIDDENAAIKATAQNVTDRETAARTELAAAIQARVDFRAAVVGGNSDVIKFLDDYVNPAVAAPSPIAPDVAAPAPDVEPPVFTDVSTPTASVDTTSGGSSDVSENIPVPPIDNQGVSDIAAAPDVDPDPTPAPAGDQSTPYPTQDAPAATDNSGAGAGGDTTV